MLAGPDRMRHRRVFVQPKPSRFTAPRDPETHIMSVPEPGYARSFLLARTRGKTKASEKNGVLR